MYQQAKIAFNRMKRKVKNLPGYTTNKSELSITTPIGSILRFKTAKDPDNLYGEDVHAAVMDEFTRMNQESWYAIRSTLTATKAPCKFIGNFKGNSNWGHQLSLKAKEESTEYEYFRITAYDAVEAGILDIEEVEQAKRDLPLFMFKALYLAEGDIDRARLIDDDAIQDLKTNNHVKQGKKYLTCDIAFEGSDKFVIGVWSGFVLIDLIAIEKSKPNEVEQIIKKTALKYGVMKSAIIFDADGVGGFLSGYLAGAKEFKGGSAPIKQNSDKQDYQNLRSQCYFNMSRRINEGGMWIKCDVSKYWSDLMEDLESVKNRSLDTDNKLSILKKEEIKKIIGRSPDFSDMLMMREAFELVPKTYRTTVVKRR